MCFEVSNEDPNKIFKLDGTQRNSVIITDFDSSTSVRVYNLTCDELIIEKRSKILYP